MAKKESKRIIIIGAGLSGLTSGIYAQKNGFVSEIFERNPLPGGLCFTWFRKGYPIDGCIHWLTGTKPGTELYDMWQDVGAFKDEDIIHLDSFGTIEYQGNKVTLWCDLNKLEKELIEISPEDEKQVKKLIKLILAIQNMKLPMDMPLSVMNPFKLTRVGLDLLPSLPMFLRYTKTSDGKYSRRFKSPILQFVMNSIIPGHNSIYANLFSYGTNCVGNGGVIKGGSQTLINNVVKTYKNLGGKITTNDVKKVVIENGVAIGVETTDGEIHKADYIIAACDNIYVLNKLLERKYKNKTLYKRLGNRKLYPLPTSCYFSYYINDQKYRELGLSSTYEFDIAPLKVGTTTHRTIKLRNYNYDSTFVKNGKSLLTIMIHQDDPDYYFWKTLKEENQQKYLEEKERIGNEIIKIITNKFPLLENSIELIDVATPLTYERYCNAYHGAYMPFAWRSKGSMYMHNGRVKGLKNFYLSGQYQQMPGGLPFALTYGKFTIQRILKKEHLPYKITKHKHVKYHK